MITSTCDHQEIADSDSDIVVFHYHVTVSGSRNRIAVFGKAFRLTGNDNDVKIFNDEPVLFTKPTNTDNGHRPVQEANMISPEDALVMW